MTEKGPIIKKIGQRLTEIRKHLGLRQKEFAEILEISPSSICDIEAGNLKPRFEIIYNLTRKYNANINYLLHGTGDMFIDQDRRIDDIDKLTDEQLEWMRNFIYYFVHSPMVRYSMMSHFLTYTRQYAELIKKDIETTNQQQGGTNEKS